MSTSVKTYDMVIVGGGIHGAGIAQAGAAAGYSVLVIEKSALAHGTSSNQASLFTVAYAILKQLNLSSFSNVFPSGPFF